MPGRRNRGAPVRGANSGTSTPSRRAGELEGRPVTSQVSQEPLRNGNPVFLQTDRVAAATARTSGVVNVRRSVLSRRVPIANQEAGGGVTALSTSSPQMSNAALAVASAQGASHGGQVLSGPRQGAPLPEPEAPVRAGGDGGVVGTGTTLCRSFRVLGAAQCGPVDVASACAGQSIIDETMVGMTEYCRDRLIEKWGRVHDPKIAQGILRWLSVFWSGFVSSLSVKGSIVEPFGVGADAMMEPFGYHYGQDMPPLLPESVLLVCDEETVYTKGHRVATRLQRQWVHGPERRTGGLDALRRGVLWEGDCVVSRRDTGGEDLRSLCTVCSSGRFWSTRIRLGFVAEIEVGGELWQCAQVLQCTNRVLPSIFGTGPQEILSKKSVREALREIPHGDPAVRARIAWGLVQAYQPDRIVSAMMRAQVTEPGVLQRMDPVDFVESVQVAERLAAEAWGVPSMTVQW